MARKSAPACVPRGIYKISHDGTTLTMQLLVQVVNGARRGDVELREQIVAAVSGRLSDIANVDFDELSIEFQAMSPYAPDCGCCCGGCSTMKHHL